MEEEIEKTEATIKVYISRLVEVYNCIQRNISIFDFFAENIFNVKEFQEDASLDSKFNDMKIKINSQRTEAKELFKNIERKVQPFFRPRTLFYICAMEVLKTQNDSTKLASLPVSVQEDLKEFPSKLKMIESKIKSMFVNMMENPFEN